MFGLVIQTLDNIGRITMIAGFIFGGVALVLSSVSAYVLYRVSNIVQEDANKRIADAKTIATEAQTRSAEANARAAEADARAAEANRKAQEAELALVKFRKARGLTPEQAETVVEKIRSFSGTKFDVGHAPVGREQWDFMWQFEPVLAKAGWVHVDWVGGEQFAKLNWTMQPRRYGVANVVNVSIEVHPKSLENLLPAAKALADALSETGIEATAGEFNNSSGNVDAIHVLVGEKR